MLLLLALLSFLLGAWFGYRLCSAVRAAPLFAADPAADIYAEMDDAARESAEMDERTEHEHTARLHPENVDPPRRDLAPVAYIFARWAQEAA